MVKEGGWLGCALPLSSFANTNLSRVGTPEGHSRMENRTDSN